MHDLPFYPRLEQPIAFLPRTLTAQTTDPLQAINIALEAYDGEPPRSAMIAVATRVDAPAIRLTNAHWTIDAQAIGRGIGLQRVTLVNDYTPVAASVTVLDDRARRPQAPRQRAAIHFRRPRRAWSRNRLWRCGPGAGRGSARDPRHRGGPCGIRAGDGGRDGSLAPSRAGRRTRDRRGRAVGPRPFQAGARPCGSPGHRLSLHDAERRALRRRDKAIPWRAKPSTSSRPGSGRFAGDLALTFEASGGVFIAGGIAPRMVDILENGSFRTAFDSKAPHDAWARTVPAFVIVNPEPALHGLAALVTDPARFVFGSQGWSA